MSDARQRARDADDPLGHVGLVGAEDAVGRPLPRSRCSTASPWRRRRRGRPASLLGSMTSARASLFSISFMRPSMNDWRSRAAWYSAFSLRSPCSRAAAIAWMTARTLDALEVVQLLAQLGGALGRDRVFLHGDADLALRSMPQVSGAIALGVSWHERASPHASEAHPESGRPDRRRAPTSRAARPGVRGRGRRPRTRASRLEAVVAEDGDGGRRGCGPAPRRPGREGAPPPPGGLEARRARTAGPPPRHIVRWRADDSVTAMSVPAAAVMRAVRRRPRPRRGLSRRSAACGAPARQPKTALGYTETRSAPTTRRWRSSTRTTGSRRRR